jgi:hypothetical protein
MTTAVTPSMGHAGHGRQQLPLALTASLAQHACFLSRHARTAGCAQLVRRTPPACQVLHGRFQSPYPSQLGMVGPPVLV